MCQICASQQFPEIHIQIKISDHPLEKHFRENMTGKKGVLTAFIYLFISIASMVGNRQEFVEVLDRRERGCQ